MKKQLPYILGAVLLALILFQFWSGGDDAAQRPLDTRFTLKRFDKIPYGTFIAHSKLGEYFPEARMTTEKASPFYWTNLSEYKSGQVLVIVTPEFKPDESEWEVIRDFIRNGNDVFISTLFLSHAAEKELKTDVVVSYLQNNAILPQESPDSMKFSLQLAEDTTPEYFLYPGHDRSTYFYGYDSSRATVLGYNKNNRPNFLHMRAGTGNLYLHLAPIAFSNYFLLHKENMAFYDKVISLLPAKASLVVWDDYFVNKKEDSEGPQKNWLSVLLGLKNEEGKASFKIAFWVAMLLLLVYVLSEMRRRQRIIPVIKAPANDSLDFVKTIGRLYHDKADHANLCAKMSSYFLEHVRSRYKLSTRALNKEFVQSLSYKSGISSGLINEIVDFITQLETGASISAQQMAWYHEKLEEFYKS